MTKGMDENITSGIFNCGDLWKCMETNTMMIRVQSMINATMKISGVVAKECLRDLLKVTMLVRTTLDAKLEVISI